MGMPHITSFFCVGLESGAKFIGYLHLLTALSFMVMGSIFAVESRSYVGTVEDSDRLYTTWYSIMVGVALVSAAHALLAINLLIGVHKRLIACVRAWVWLMCVVFVLALGYVVVAMWFGFSSSGSDIYLAFIGGVAFFGVTAYCIICVYSYYLLLKSSEDMAGPKYY